MRNRKRKRNRIGLQIFLGVVLAGVLSVSIRSIKVENELSSLKDYSKLFCKHDFDWKKHSFGLWNIYYFDNRNGNNFTVFPTGSYFTASLLSFSHIKLKNFPKDLWSEFKGMGTFYYPSDENNYNKNWDGALVHAVSFNKPYSISQIQGYFSYGKIKWLWLDTYGNRKENQAEYYIQDGNAANGAYGILCNEELKGNALQIDSWKFIDMINKYNSKNLSETGKKLYKIKHSIKAEGDIAITDLKIIGCIFYPNDNQDEQMRNDPIFKVVQ